MDKTRKNRRARMLFVEMTAREAEAARRMAQKRGLPLSMLVSAMLNKLK